LLEKDVSDIFKIEKAFNEMQQKQYGLISEISKKDLKLAELKPAFKKL